MIEHFIVNGQQVRAEDLPEDARRALEQLRNGADDVDFEALSSITEAAGTRIVKTNSNTKVILNGGPLDNIKDLPDDVRKAMLDSGMFTDHDGNGIPDILENGQANPFHESFTPGILSARASTYSSENKPISARKGSTAQLRQQAGQTAGQPLSIKAKDDALKRRQNITNALVVAALVAAGLYVFLSGPV